MAVIPLAASLLLLLPAGARADGILGGFIGTNFGGKTETSTPVYGGVLGGVGTGLGFEVDFGYAPDFFDTEEVSGTRLSITTVMANLVVGGGRDRGVAPFVSGGVGLIRTNIDDPGELIENLSTNDFGMNVGGGLNLMFGTVGIRGDVRYFRNLESNDEDDGFLDLDLVDLGDFDFWRGTVGIVIRW
jgi:hypothetical protein